jgi:hypothetical protein
VTQITSTIRKHRPSAKLAAEFAISAMLALGAVATPANAEWDGRHHDREYNHYYNGGYYSAPPVVYGSRYGGAYYGSPYYYPPPVVYAPGIGINLGGVGIAIR